MTEQEMRGRVETWTSAPTQIPPAFVAYAIGFPGDYAPVPAQPFTPQPAQPGSITVTPLIDEDALAKRIAEKVARKLAELRKDE